DGSDLAVGRRHQRNEPMLFLLMIAVRHDRLAPCRSTVLGKSKIHVISFVGFRSAQHQPMRCKRAVRHHGNGWKIRRIDEPVCTARYRFWRRPGIGLKRREVKDVAFSSLPRLDPGHEDAAVGTYREVWFSAARSGWRLELTGRRSGRGCGHRQRDKKREHDTESIELLDHG